MPQNTHRDLEGGSDLDDHHDPQSTPNQKSQGESNFGDSSGPFFSIYSKAAEEEDNKMVERWQKDADGILIFAGLFSAAVAALLAVTVQDLRPNSQDTSAFYLGNIYEVLADPNATRAPIPSPVAKPPPFSPPRYAVWVNLLWFLSLVISVSCALLATSLHQWARRYIRLTQPARRSPEKRARMRAFFANGVDKMHIPWAVEGLPTLLHLSLFLFFGGLVVFLFNVNQEVFTGVVWWIGLFSVVYVLITLLPLIRQDSPYYTPLTIPARLPYIGTISVIFLTPPLIILMTLVVFCAPWYCGRDSESWDPFKPYFYWIDLMLGGVMSTAEEMASQQSSDIDIRILDWTISALGDDDSLEKFFEAIPGLFKSKLVKHLEKDIPVTLLRTFWSALDGFMRRTLSSNSVTESVKSRRVIICRDIISMIPCHHYMRHLRSHFNQAPVSIERLQAMARWCSHKDDDVVGSARVRVAKKLARIRERDEDWIALASDVCGLAADDIRDNIALGVDSVLLATLIDLSRRAILSGDLKHMKALTTQFDICHTLPRLQHDFCSLWNELVQEGNRLGGSHEPLLILREIRHHYITLHRGTDAAPTAFFASTGSWYPLCHLASHHPDATAPVSVPDPRVVTLLTQFGYSPNALPLYSTSAVSTVSQQVSTDITGTPSPCDPTIPGKVEDSSRAPALPAHTGPRPIDASPPAAVAALQDIAPASPLEGTAQLDIIAPCAELDDTVSASAPTPSVAPMPTSTPPVLNTSLASSARGAVSTPNPLLPTPSVVILSILSSPLSSHSVRGPVNTRSTCFANAMLQLFVHSPPFRTLFKELGDLKTRGRRVAGVSGTGGSATPLVDATMRFFEEAGFEEEPAPPAQRLPERAARGDFEEKRKDVKVVGAFEPMYLYDAMKEKRQLKDLLPIENLKDGKYDYAETVLGLYLDALDEELVELQTYISTHKLAGIEELEGEAQSAEAQNAVGRLDYTAGLIESPISRIFGGRTRSTIRAPNQPDTVTIEAWRSLQLNIQPESVHTIQDALRHVSQPQPVQVGQSSSSEASKQVLLEVLPPILVLHLGRFLQDATADGIVKIRKPVQFAPELEIPLEMMAPIAGKSVEPAHYKLHGVLYHHGESAGGEHYTVDVLRPNGDSGSGEAWLHIDDEIVSAVRDEAVFGGHGNEQVDDRCANMLFYCSA